MRNRLGRKASTAKRCLIVHAYVEQRLTVEQLATRFSETKETISLMLGVLLDTASARTAAEVYTQLLDFGYTREKVAKLCCVPIATVPERAVKKVTVRLNSRVKAIDYLRSPVYYPSVYYGDKKQWEEAKRQYRRERRRERRQVQKERERLRRMSPEQYERYIYNKTGKWLYVEYRNTGCSLRADNKRGKERRGGL